ncbi:predicted protein [Coccidioides posadasii str. Silveira]|uniref:Predicted protein n=1 Tax=Coccidioides posadasii (strain RMSCC 757 / Silveira) TaxID=443226 RepID=E9CX83_COCPS|nr:predicted protein [Coccidioides posadasii str. Silveira]
MLRIRTSCCSTFIIAIWRCILKARMRIPEQEYYCGRMVTKDVIQPPIPKKRKAAELVKRPWKNKPVWDGKTKGVGIIRLSRPRDGRIYTVQCPPFSEHHRWISVAH